MGPDQTKPHADRQSLIVPACYRLCPHPPLPHSLVSRLGHCYHIWRSLALNLSTPAYSLCQTRGISGLWQPCPNFLLSAVFSESTALSRICASLQAIAQCHSRLQISRGWTTSSTPIPPRLRECRPSPEVLVHDIAVVTRYNNGRSGGSQTWRSLAG
jgi:hypothetical protein